jgi:uncharacterized protein (DUF983 family)
MEIENVFDPNDMPDLELTSPWLEGMRKECPICDHMMAFEAGLTTPNAAKAYCLNCGFQALMTAPRADWDKCYPKETIVRI